jgi:hypothetical protein
MLPTSEIRGREMKGKTGEMEGVYIIGNVHKPARCLTRIECFDNHLTQ